MTVLPTMSPPQLRRLLDADVAALYRLVLNSLPPSQRQAVAAASRVLGWDFQASLRRSLYALDDRTLEVLVGALADHLSARLEQADLAATYRPTDVDAALVELGRALG